MKKTANFIVNKRGIVMSVILLLAIICAFLMQQVEINSDMTKYLADDSSMKIGLLWTMKISIFTVLISRGLKRNIPENTGGGVGGV